MVNFPTLDALIEATVPASIRREVCPVEWRQSLAPPPVRLTPSPPPQPMNLGKYHEPLTESEHLAALKCVGRPAFPGHTAPGPVGLTPAALVPTGRWRRRTRC